MNVPALACAVLLGLTVAGPVIAQGNRPTDTGNMAYPAPLPQGNVGTSATGGARVPTDTGNMAYPTPLPQGNIGTSATSGARTPTDTGNMAYPAPLPQGNVGTTQVK